MSKDWTEATAAYDDITMVVSAINKYTLLYKALFQDKRYHSAYKKNAYQSKTASCIITVRFIRHGNGSCVCVSSHPCSEWM